MEEVVQTAELTKPEEPKPPTRAEIGKMRRKFLTVHHSRVMACNHKFKQGKLPNNNCEHCWFAYFRLTADIEAIHAALTQDGPKSLAGKYGDKFVKMFSRYLYGEMSTLGANNGSTERVFDSDEGADRGTEPLEPRDNAVPGVHA